MHPSQVAVECPNFERYYATNSQDAAGMKRTEEVTAQPTAISKNAENRRSKVVGLAQYKDRAALEKYRRALNTVVSNAQKADW